MKITTGVIWPGKGSVDWDSVRQAIPRMNVGDTFSVDFDTYDDVEACRKSVMAFARQSLRCYQNGWCLRSTKRGRTLYFTKLAFSK